MTVSTYILVPMCDISMWPHGSKVILNASSMNKEICLKQTEWKYHKNVERPVIINIVSSLISIDTTENKKFGVGVVSVYRIISKMASLDRR
jgi:hypothetical protein